MNQQTIKQRLANPQLFKHYVHLVRNQPTEVVESFYEALKSDGIDHAKGLELETMIKERLGL